MEAGVVRWGMNGARGAGARRRGPCKHERPPSERGDAMAAAARASVSIGRCGPGRRR